MDATIRKLVLEIARTVVRVLEAEDAPKRESPSPARKTLDQLLKNESLPTSASNVVCKGDAVRIWTGNMYAVGTVDHLYRAKGESQKVRVRVGRGDGRRDKLHEVDRARCELIKKGDA